MAVNQSKKPRLRKTAPTIRERAEAAQKEPPKKRRGFIRKGIGKLFFRARIPRNKATNPFFKVGRLIVRFLRWLVPSYFVNSWHEVKQVTWPGRVETWRLTLAVFMFAIIFGIAIGIVDKILNEIFKRIILN